MRTRLFILALLVLPWAWGCEDPLDVQNVNNPNRDDVLAQPADLENWIRDSFNAWFRAAFAGENIQPQMRVMALENHSELANFNQGPRYLIPRNFIENTRGAAGTGEMSSTFIDFSRATRAAALGLAKLDEVTLGSASADARGRAFAWFSLGLSLGYLSVPFDSAATAWPTDDPACTQLECLPPLVGYAEVNAKAIEALDSAEAVAGGSVSFSIPSSWLRQGSDVSQADFLRLIRSYRAVIRIGVARSPAEREALDWSAAISDANNGITSDFMVSANPSIGWSIAWPTNVFRAGSWHGVHQFMIGGADTTGAFEAWLNTARADRDAFLIRTPDRRFPAGETRDDQSTGQVALPPGQYYRNRPSSEDTPGDPLGNSQYDHYRFRPFFDANRIAPFPILTRAEVDLIAAEGYIRQSDFGNAMGKINPTRIAAGLPELTGITSLTDSVPGGTACVPRVPSWTGSAYTAPCGNIWEAMKWEKRLETHYTNFANWFMDSRGWGDLPEGTPVHFPVPWQEKDTRRLPFIEAFGGCAKLGTGESTGASNYGPALSCSPI
jgi:hypothetical protein